ncbi:MAG TPA: chemotaxis protein CheW [Acidimicrobiales bacterium]|nr:chemotaxis protein CheW [Acidimicrobiales bacterium]
MSAEDKLSLHTRYCTFRLGNLLLGIDVGQVQEVLRHDQMTTVPLAPAEVRGLINLRGQIVTAVDLRRQFGLAPSTELSLSAVVRAGDETISLLVDDVGEVVETSPEDFEPVPVSVPARVRNLIAGTYKLAGKLLLVLDLQRVEPTLEQREDNPLHQPRQP